MRWRVALALAVLLAACTDPTGPAEVETPQPPSGTAHAADWLLEGSEHDRFERIARQLRGFDVAMIEVGYRYSELYWAGRDENWSFARYQLEKIRTTMTNAIERRPARAASARMMDTPLASIETAIGARDRASFDRAFEELTGTCNACHRAERVEFMTVVMPTARLSPVRFGEASAP